MSSGTTLLSFERFCHLLSVEFDFEIAITRDTRLVDLLRLDSFELLRIAVFMESLAPIERPDEIDSSTLSVGTLYDAYVGAAIDAGLES